MSIDWLTVIIQAVNFLVLVWILKRFLYKPVLNAMDNRQKAVFAKLHEAEKREKAAEKVREELTEERNRVKSESKQVLLQAQKEADSEKSKMMKITQEDMRDKQLRFEHQLEVEKKALYGAVRQLAGETLVQTAKDAMSELATKDLEKDMFTIFAEKIKGIKSDTFDSLIQAIKKEHAVVLTSAHTPSDAEKAKIESALKEVSGVSPKMVYKENKELICGIEILADTTMVRWGFDKYIENFGRALTNALNAIAG
ncbi:MAG: hypothetical protein JW812_02035 [Alphaproteobacteria bacterium]|nr:hypothetical protein [Alphaproteobacteria bacterium]MBN2780244.1 hypothetical protein [Alphaproteobacteria bacterium]